MSDQARDIGTLLAPAATPHSDPSPNRPPAAAGLPHPLAAAANAPEKPAPTRRDNEVDVRTLVIGPQVSLSGTISCCKRLIVEGTIDAAMDKCENVIIAETGVFRGTSATENADVRGRFDGDLMVHKRLLVRATGQVSGTISYGEIEIECGGMISGSVEARGR